MKKILVILLTLVIIVVVGILFFAPAIVEKQQNRIVNHQPYTISLQAQTLHDSLVVGDWHVDSLLWNRDLRKRSNFGQLDIPRMQQGNVGLQVFTTVTKSPAGLNYDRNETDAADNITRLAIIQRWPLATWDSLTARAQHQAERLHRLIKDNPDELMLITSQVDLQQWQAKRQTKPRLIGALLGTEGSHALDGDLENVQALFEQGFRMMSLQHFFDNKLGGSLHGTSQTGLTDFGAQVVRKIDQLKIILDVSHSSENGVEDVLKITQRPVVVSHTGFKGHCNSPRNISDELVQKIAANGGLIAVGYWQGAICGTHPDDIATAIKYGIELIGEDHVSLGSDFDGSVATAIDTSELAAITQALININVSEIQIEKVMGGNMLRFLSEYLPE